MSGLFHNLGLVWCLFLTTALSDQVLPPENVRLSWIEGLYQKLTWTPPQHSLHNCHYNITSTVKIDGSERPASYKVRPGTQPEKNLLSWKEISRPLNGGFINVSIQTVCNGLSSKAVFDGINDEDLELDCAVRSSSLVHCSWKSPPSAQLRFFYNAALEPTSSRYDDLRECPHYTERRSGCDLPVKTRLSRHDLSVLPVNLLLNGTLYNRTIRNIHHITSLKMKLPPLDWTVTDYKEKFIINWTLPPFDLNWIYLINYTACDNTWVRREKPEPPFELKREANCSYRFSMRALVDVGGEEKGGTEWTTEKRFGAVSDPNLAVLAAVLVPLVLAVLVVLTLFWCWRNKDRIWPKVPQPNPNILQDLLNNNNKTSFHSPRVDEECVVTLVIDPKKTEL